MPNPDPAPADAYGVLFRTGWHQRMQRVGGALRCWFDTASGWIGGDDHRWLQLQNVKPIPPVAQLDLPRFMANLTPVARP